MEYSIKLKNNRVLRGFISIPSDTIRANIILIHGLGGHIRRYEKWVAMFNSLLHCAMSAGTYSPANDRELKTALLLMHGSDDQICSAEGSRQFASGTSLVDLKIWEGGYHELHNETFKNDVFAYLINWINNRLA